MRTLRFLIPLLLLTAFGQAAEVLPSLGKGVGLVHDESPGKWVAFAQDFEPVEAIPFDGDKDTGWKGCYFQGTPGKYVVLKIEDGTPKAFRVVIGGAVPVPPTPIPPGPEVPPLPPVVAGPRQVLILRESAEDTPALARLVTSFQAGKGHEYLKSKGHVCFFLDDDSKTGNGRPSIAVEKWKLVLNLPMPVLAILDEKGNILHKSTLGPDATADEVLTILKGKGG